ncbi:pyridoxamine 5'-phosphate oxidase family protein [Erysipelothrix sp. HDW6C]|uniref:pyridoxamine 5'-phosphate oxidase family protein n=1 Tax=Erysipelothrix sp. HDW6C TaxID=2714930 RepID=UPI00140A7A1D|nr:pyridoxamine 5'-phosphate oxidase family protein [Erysipelothrix sp. HDW6C]QIK70395.1 pyridoxamine 5'-phosphate oxidase family protein [Erysipelothrix sp. HDW6C]
MKQHIEPMISRQTIAYLSSVDAAGFPITKAISKPRKRDGLKVMYFTTKKPSTSVADYERNNKASVFFADEDRFQSASFIGHMEVETDAAIIDELWAHENAKVFSKGATKDEYCVLKFVADSVKFFSNYETAVYEL